MADSVLVTGAAGFVGRHLLGLLARDAARLVAWRRPGEAPADPIVPDDGDGTGTGRVEVEWDELDVVDGEAVARAVAHARPEAVYHLAGAAHVGQSWIRTDTTLAVNVLGTHHLLEALRRQAFPARVLSTGSAMVYRPSDAAIAEDAPLGPVSPYGLSKLAQEALGRRACEDDGIPTLLVRAFNHLGPGQSPGYFASSFARQIARIEAGLAEPVLVVGNLDARRDLTDVRDTVRAYRALVHAGVPGRPYNVCSGQAWTIGAVLDALLARALVKVGVRVDAALLRPNDVPLVLGSHERLSRDTGWVPRIPLEQTLTDLLDDWRHRVAASPDA